MKINWKGVLLIVGFVFLLFIAWYFKSIVIYIVLAGIMSMMGRPIMRNLAKVKIGKFQFSKSFSAIITLILLWLAIFGFFRFMVPTLMMKFQELANVDVNSFIAQIEDPLDRILRFIYGESYVNEGETIIDFIAEKLTSFFNMSQISGIVGVLAGAIGDLLIGIFAVSFISFFFLKDYGMMRQMILLFIPGEFEERVSRSLESIYGLLRRYIIGLLLEIFMVMVLDAFGLLIIGIDFSDAVVIGLFCGLFNVIPYLGPWLGAAAGVLIGIAINLDMDFMSQTLPLLGLMVVVFGSVQMIDNILFQPLIYSNSVKAHPLEIFLVIMAAGSVFGVTGMVLAIPVYTVIRVLAAEFLSHIKIVRKITETMNKEPKKKKKRNWFSKIKENRRRKYHLPKKSL